MGGRFLQRLQQRVESLGRQHVRLVDDVNLGLEHRRQILDALSQIADLVDAAVGGRIDLDQVDGGTARDFDAVGADATGLRALPVQAVDRLRQDSGGRRFPSSANPRKQVGVGNAPLYYGVLQGLGNRILPDQVAKRLRPVLEVKGLVRHRLPRQFYGAAARIT